MHTHRRTTRIACTSLVLGVAGAIAAGAPAASAMTDLPPWAVTADRSAVLPDLRLVGDPSAAADAVAADQTPAVGIGVDRSPQRRRYVLPVLLSALVPGAGEIAAGHPWRGLPFVAGDVATWVGYAHFRDEGRAWRTQYEAYADEHWNYSRFGDTNGNGDRDPGEVWGWQESLERYYDESQPNPALRWWQPGAPYNCNCPYVSREEDRQHYYENVGKYRYYWQGWDDWLYNPSDPVNSDSQSHRREYGQMRIESNDNFDNATRLVVVGMATRLASMVQTVFLVRADINAEQQFSLRPAMLPGHAAGIELSFKY